MEAALSFVYIGQAMGQTGINRDEWIMENG